MNITNIIKACNGENDKDGLENIFQCPTFYQDSKKFAYNVCNLLDYHTSKLCKYCKRNSPITLEDGKGKQIKYRCLKPDKGSITDYFPKEGFDDEY